MNENRITAYSKYFNNSDHHICEVKSKTYYINKTINKRVIRKSFTCLTNMVKWRDRLVSLLKYFKVRTARKSDYSVKIHNREDVYYRFQYMLQGKRMYAHFKNIDKAIKFRDEIYEKLGLKLKGLECRLKRYYDFKKIDHNPYLSDNWEFYKQIERIEL